MKKIKITTYKKNPHDISIRLRNKEHKAKLLEEAKGYGVSLNALMNDIIQRHINGS